MSTQLTITRSGSGGGTAKSQVTTFTGTELVVVDTTVATATTDDPITMALDVGTDTLLGYYIYSDQAITIDTNAIDGAGSTGNTIALAANNPLVHTGASDYYTSLLTVNVTIMYITNTSGSTANIKMIFCQTSTP